MTTHVQYTNAYTMGITKNICDHTCTTYTYMHHQTHVHHQIPPKYKIYPAGLPSVLYKTPGPNERSVLNQLFLVLFFVLFTFQVLFMKTTMLFIVSFWVITKYRFFIRKTKHLRNIGLAKSKCIGRSRGVHPARAPPPTGSDSFILTCKIFKT